jgi:hypothetical protein
VIDIEQRQANRLLVMKAIFDASGGSEHKEVLGHELAAKLGLTDQELGDACRYLAGEGLIEEAAPDMSGSPVPYWVNIRHLGIKEIEQSLRAPNEPTKHFPPAISVIHIEGNVIGSAIQSGSPGAQQEMSIGDLDLGAVREFLREYDAHAADLELSGPAADELAAEIDTVRAQLRSPKPKKHIIRESLVSVRIILEVTSGTAAAVGFLDLLKLVHL